MQIEHLTWQIKLKNIKEQYKQLNAEHYIQFIHADIN
jgi:hypothetical protein